MRFPAWAPAKKNLFSFSEPTEEIEGFGKKKKKGSHVNLGYNTDTQDTIFTAYPEFFFHSTQKEFDLYLMSIASKFHQSV